MSRRAQFAGSWIWLRDGLASNLPDLSFDAASQLIGISYLSGSTTLGTLTYGYDQAGHIVSRAGTLFQSVLPAPVSSATYDLANRLTARSAAGMTLSPPGMPTAI